MIKTLKKDIKARSFFFKNEIDFLVLRYLKNSDYYYIKNLDCFLSKKKKSLSIINNFCIVSGRSRSVYSKFRVSRIILKEFTVSGTFSNLKKL